MSRFIPEFDAFVLTLQLALVTSLILLIIALPLGWWLARSRWRHKYIIETLVALPLVLPPTVLGFYLLLALGPQGPLSPLLTALGVENGSLAFTFPGLVIGSMIYSFPFVVQPVRIAFDALDPAQMESAATLGAGPIERFLTIALPAAKGGLITGGVLGFAHTLGEFGVVLMIGGNIPGETRVASIAIYENVESLDYARAHGLSAMLIVLSAALLLLIYRSNRQIWPGRS